MAVPVAAAAAAHPSPRGPCARATAGAHTRAARRLPARIRTTAVRPLLSESLDARCDRDLRFGAVGESALPLLDGCRLDGEDREWRSTLTSASPGSGPATGRFVAPRRRPSSR